jgi:NAD(P)H dehydrogenase (quinone)
MATVLVLFHSQEFGNTAAMAEAVAAGARSAGAEVKLVNTNERRMDIDGYRAADGVAFGSPDYYSYIAGGLKMFLDDWHIAKQADETRLTGKPFGLFYSHGGGGKVREPMEKLFGTGIGTKVGKTIESQGKPTAAVVAACRELGKQVAQAVGL